MALGFRGDVADFYHRYRRGYPPESFDVVAEVFGLTPDDVAVDLGCGTGQVTVPLAGRVRAVVGVDPEPDMLARGRRAAADRGVANVSWVVGTDADVPALRAALGDGSVGVVTIAQALHWMRHDELFHALRPLVRPGGGVAVLTNGRPLWSQDNDWSRALRACLERWLGTPARNACGTDEESQSRYRESLGAAGFDVDVRAIDYTDTLDVESVVGGVLSALPVDRLPSPAERPAFAERVRQALEPHAPFTEHVRVTVLTGRR
ncbi:methyltransferase domain-containing protein [Saccharothrix sp. S26]|uniref:class I SAM-dependent methyltransferase n=1 Tax=Saccharothrix sp. S26 TaxID=2907215 RepID=UPI001F2CC5E5|nr:class I SAM-dependent methyltransferase [Saccharothrix sp. S26]MCE6994083.1 methyltransferase domain-containing protein [Saccharothrix sp. S26]